MRALQLGVAWAMVLATVAFGQSSTDLLSPTHLNRGTTGLFNVADSPDLGPPLGCKLVAPSKNITYQNVREGGYCWFGPLREVGTHWITVTYNTSNNQPVPGDSVSVLVTDKTSFELSGDIKDGGSFFQGYGGVIAARPITANWLQGICPTNTEATITLRVNDSELTTLPTDCKVTNGYVTFSAGLYDYLPIPDACLESTCALSAWVRLGTGKAMLAGGFTLVPGMYAKNSTVEVVLFREDSRKLCLRANAVTRLGYPTGIKRNSLWSPQCTSVTVVGPRDFCCAFDPLDPLDPQVEFSFFISAATWVTVSATRAEKEGGTKSNLTRIIVPAAVALLLCLIAAAVFLARRLRRQAAAYQVKKKVIAPRVDPRSKRERRREQRKQRAALARKQLALQSGSGEPEPEVVTSSDSGSSREDSESSVQWEMEEEHVEYTNVAQPAIELRALDPPRPGQLTPVEVPPVLSVPAIQGSPVLTAATTPTPMALEEVQYAEKASSQGTAEEGVPLAVAPKHGGSDFFEKNDSPRPFKSAPRYTVGGAAASMSWEQVEPRGAIEFRFNPATTSDAVAGLGMDDPTPLPTPTNAETGDEPRPAFASQESERRGREALPRGKNTKKPVPSHK